MHTGKDEFCQPWHPYAPLVQDALDPPLAAMAASRDILQAINSKKVDNLPPRS
jgi:hypothetical protein